MSCKLWFVVNVCVHSLAGPFGLVGGCVVFGRSMIDSLSVVVLLGIEFSYGEFDPGSGRTLAACLTHASRTMKPSLLGGLVANG